MKNLNLLNKKTAMDWREITGVVLVLALAVFIRLLPYSRVFSHAQVNLFAQDPYYHLRRVLLGLNNHGIIPTYDSYSGFPQGLYCFWSNLFDYSILWVSWLFGHGKPSIHLVETVTAYTPVAWGVLCLLPAYLVIKETFNKQIAFISLILMSILPGQVYQTLLGRADHYGADTLFPLLASYLLLKLNRRTDLQSNLNYLVGISLSLALSWLIWPGSTIFVGILLSYQLIMILYDIKCRPESMSLTLDIAVKTTLLTLIWMLPFCMTSYWGFKHEVIYDALSYFQLYFLAGFLVLFLIIKFIHETPGEYLHYLRQYPVLTTLGSIILVFTCLFALVPHMSQSLFSGLGWVAKTDPWLKTITEFQPLFMSMGVFSDFRALSYFGYIIYLAPILYILLIHHWYQQNQWTPARIWYVLYIGSVLVLGYNQSRFAHYMVLGIASLTAVTLVYIFYFLQAYTFPPKVQPYKQPLILLVIIMLISGNLRPALSEIRAIPGKYAQVNPEFMDCLSWIKSNTPATSHYLQPYDTPEYGILAPWIMGHWINYYAQRPTFCNGFHTDSTNNKKGMEFYMSEDVAHTVDILAHNKIKYFLLTDLTVNIPDFVDVLGIKGKNYVFKSVTRHPKGGVSIGYNPTEQYYRLISSILYIHDGDGLVFTNKGVFRLVYESKSQWDVDKYMVNCLKLYEFIPGCAIEGVTKPNTPIEISTVIQTNSGRQFNYHLETNATPKGTYRIFLPYSQESSSKSAFALKPYTVKLGNKTSTVSVNNEWVASGKTITLP